MSERPIIPVKQVRIAVAGATFIAVLLSNGETGLVFSQLCEFLGLEAKEQIKRLHRHPTLSAALVLVEIETAGGPQASNVLLSWGIILWLERIRRGRRPKMYQERLIAFQRDARAALSKEFFQNPTEEPPPPKREKRSTSLERPSSIREARQAIRRAREALAQAEEQWMDLIEQRQQALEDQLQRSEGQPAPSRSLDPEEEPTGSMPLTLVQYQKLVDLLQQLSRRSRVPYKVLELHLSDYCGADRRSAISQAAWPEALAWVNSRPGAG